MDVNIFKNKNSKNTKELSFEYMHARRSVVSVTFSPIVYYLYMFSAKTNPQKMAKWE